ncbi:MAG: helix-turn-helix domain-containing protein [Actinobacteria bacterium]|nr:helix-turn-helix domain-containing protein [Actinomycetota bacterium]
MAGDTYSAAEAARVLRVSERRVRQLVDDGHLQAVQESPLRISAQSVIEERKRREKKPTTTSPVSAGRLRHGRLRHRAAASG